MNSILQYPKSVQRRFFDYLYVEYSKRAYVSPDPIEILYTYNNTAEREIAGFLTASLALGRAGLITRTAQLLLNRLPSPLTDIQYMNKTDIQKAVNGLYYRFFSEHHLSGIVYGLSNILKKYGSLESAFEAKFYKNNNDIHKTLIQVTMELIGYSGPLGILIPDPRKQSSCKRLYLFFRWMIRNDKIDPGGWSFISPSKLILPLDTHMLRVAKQLGITKKNQASITAAREITHFFSGICPEDPVKYDFALTRFGIHPDLNYETLKKMYTQPQNNTGILNGTFRIAENNILYSIV